MIQFFTDYMQRSLVCVGLLVGSTRRGYATYVTLPVRASNLAAQRFYRRLGFRATGIMRGYYADTNEDAIRMAYGTEPRS